jgi:hypothetical protein
MTPEENKAVVQRFYDQWNSGAIDFERLVHVDVANHQPDRDPEIGLDAFRQAIEAVGSLQAPPPLGVAAEFPASRGALGRAERRRPVAPCVAPLLDVPCRRPRKDVRFRGFSSWAGLESNQRPWD